MARFLWPGAFPCRRRYVSFISFENSTRHYYLGVNMSDNNPRGALTTPLVLDITIYGAWRARGPVHVEEILQRSASRES